MNSRHKAKPLCKRDSCNAGNLEDVLCTLATLPIGLLACCMCLLQVCERGKDGARHHSVVSWTLRGLCHPRVSQYFATKATKSMLSQ